MYTETESTQEPTQTSTAGTSLNLSQKTLEILATVGQHVDTSTIPWDAVAKSLGYKNAETAKKRYQQVKKQILDASGTNISAKSDKKVDGLRETDGSSNNNKETPKKRGRPPKNTATSNNKEDKENKEKKGITKRISKKAKIAVKEEEEEGEEDEIEKYEGSIDGDRKLKEGEESLKIEAEN
ncbi:hypothetical protein TWF694_009515 [Orbilia ellipsospora]|uniref:Myb-like DNA-binding domain-containing protein n=1 Tax=Orbilia ellipsospora TaxID=2528407 RepID=A0AAV9XC38_9PEZI